MNIEQIKQQMREDVLKKRQQAHHILRARAAQDIIGHFMSSISPAPGISVAGYWPLSGELDDTALLQHLCEKDFLCCLPVVVQKGEVLAFRRWQPGMKLEEGYSGTRHPPQSSPETVPDILLVPLIAFDRAGYRLGYGGGFYDRTLHHLRTHKQIIAVGVAYAAQQVPIVPHEGRDERLDWVITEEGAIRCS